MLAIAVGLHGEVTTSTAVVWHSEPVADYIANLLIEKLIVSLLDAIPRERQTAHLRATNFITKLINPIMRFLQVIYDIEESPVTHHYCKVLLRSYKKIWTQKLSEN